jgi:ABC-2 type transport system ATP-binding protein
MDARVVLLDQGSVLAAGSVPDLISSRGTPVVEMTFDGPPPESLGALGDFVTDSTLRMDAKDPPHVIAEVLRLLGPAASCVLGIEILKPSLETVYLTLTGHRYAEDDRDEVAA